MSITVRDLGVPQTWRTGFSAYLVQTVGKFHVERGEQAPVRVQRRGDARVTFPEGVANVSTS
jgi:hypothetical protein